MTPEHRAQVQSLAASVLALGLGQSPAKCVTLIKADPAGTLERVAAALRAIDPQSPYAADVELLQQELLSAKE